MRRESRDEDKRIKNYLLESFWSRSGHLRWRRTIPTLMIEARLWYFPTEGIGFTCYLWERHTAKQQQPLNLVGQGRRRTATTIPINTLYWWSVAINEERYEMKTFLNVAHRFLLLPILILSPEKKKKNKIFILIRMGLIYRPTICRRMSQFLSGSGLIFGNLTRHRKAGRNK